MKLVDMHGNAVDNPSPDQVRMSFKDVVRSPKNEAGYTSIRLEREDGWRLTAYGSTLLVLDHEDGSENPPSHLADLPPEDALEICGRFAVGASVDDQDWKLGYGPA